MGKAAEKEVEVVKDITYEAILQLGTTASFLLDVLIELEHTDPTMLLVGKLYDEVVKTKGQLRNHLLEYLEGLPMRSVEEVLRVVADSEYYTESGGGAYMCLSLSRAVVGGLISVEESYLAEKEIESYLRDLGCDGGGTLWIALSENSLPNDFISRKAIYLDWNNRPKP